MSTHAAPTVSMTEKIAATAKFWVGLVSVSATAALGVLGPESPLFTGLTILAAVSGAVSIYLVPNKEPVVPEEDTLADRPEDEDDPQPDDEEFDESFDPDADFSAEEEARLIAEAEREARETAPEAVDRGAPKAPPA